MINDFMLTYALIECTTHEICSEDLVFVDQTENTRCVRITSQFQ